MTKGGTVDQPMARHATKRTLMAVHPMGNQLSPIIVLWKITRNYTCLRLRLETGVCIKSAFIWYILPIHC